MKTLLTILLSLCLLFMPACSSTGGGGAPTADVGPIVSAAVIFYTTGHPERVVMLKTAADALDVLSEGVVNKETVLRLLRTHLGSNDPAMNAIVTLLVGYFPAGSVGVPQNEQLSKLAKQVADAIRAGLPAV